MRNDTIDISKDWVTIEDYQFKILILVTVLAQNNLAYRGTLTNMCEWLGIANAPKNTKGIKEAIEELEKKQYIFYHKEGQTHHISITNKGLKNKTSVKVRRQWIKTIKEFNIAKNSKVNRNWDTMTKALIIILYKLEEMKEDLNIYDGIIITMKELGNEINKSEATAGKVANNLTECNFEDGLKITKDTQYIIKDKADGTKNIKAIGSYIRVFYDWEEKQAKP